MRTRWQLSCCDRRNAPSGRYGRRGRAWLGGGGRNGTGRAGPGRAGWVGAEARGGRPRAQRAALGRARRRRVLRAGAEKWGGAARLGAA